MGGHDPEACRICNEPMDTKPLDVFRPNVHKSCFNKELEEIKKISMKMREKK